MGLGKWAVIDIETTGINPLDDDIIDLGFWQFEGTQLVRKFTSLVRSQRPISPFIQKLTGIDNSMLKKAPMWEQVEPDLLELEKHSLVAHNAAFEEKFLKRHFDRIDKSSERESFQDSILYLGLLFPGAGQLNLESFIQKFGIADKEEHRGEADSRDLLKVLVAATALTWKNRLWRMKLSEVFMTMPDDFWFKHFFQLSWEELMDLGEVCEMDVGAAMESWLSFDRPELASRDYPDAAKMPRKFSGEVVRDFLTDTSARQEKVPGYRARQAQIDMALRVGQAFKNNIHALIQAPTGTGKTLGYLLPSTLFSLESKEQVLVATGTKTLQDQVMEKDVPQLRQMLQLSESDFKITRLVGSNNHLCELLFRDDENQKNLLEESSFSGQYARAYFDMLFFHNESAPYAKKITREQVPFILKKLMPDVRDKDEELAVDYRACVGSQCPFVLNCSYVQGLREAKEAQLIVGNHSMLLSWPRSFPRPTHVIVDEAHKIEGEATKAFAVEISDRSVEALLKVQPQGVGALLYLLSNQEHSIREEEFARIRDAGQFASRMARDHVTPLLQVLESIFKKTSNYHPVHMNELPFPSRERANDALSIQLLNHLESLLQIWGDLYSVLMPHFERFEKKEFGDDKNKMKAWALFESFWGQLEKHVMGLTHFIKPPTLWITALKYSEEQGWLIESAPIDVGLTLHKGLLESASSVVYTSATLANDKGDAGTQGVEWMTGYSYLPQEKRFKGGLYLPATFDYEKRAKVMLVNDTRAISDPMFVPDLLKPIIPLVKELNGRTLFLFSARARFELAVDLLLKEFEGHLPVFVQGMGKNVVEEFKKSANGILVGMESFGEGIDVPGEQLQLIIIDKIPDVRRELVIDRRREWYESSFGNEFQDYFLANRARALHQKCGRLLRREEDFGGVIIVDQRIKKWKGHTLKQFAKLLEPYKVEVTELNKACEEMRDFLIK
ncbi:MAG: DEAD/DEAH box helicase family protein [Bacteriovoracaceae bacterium]|nr:DEAD/DEAH box helicase family protein [Bacteriovoracaceae bacterium]